MHRFDSAIWILALMASACGSSTGSTGPGSSGTALTDRPTFAQGSIPRCEDVLRISAPAERYRDSPIYVANEQPTEEIRAWAAGKPGFEEIWIDRDHLGWITVAFSVDRSRTSIPFPSSARDQVSL